jgi:hypothetical protein
MLRARHTFILLPGRAAVSLSATFAAKTLCFRKSLASCETAGSHFVQPIEHWFLGFLVFTRLAMSAEKQKTK